MKTEFRMLNKEAVQNKIQTVTVDLNSRKDLYQKLRELRKENYVVEYEFLNTDNKAGAQS